MQHTSTSRVVPAFAACLLASCQSTPPASESEPQVRAAVQAWAAAFNECSAEKAASLYAPEAVLWGTVSQELISTPEGIRQYFARACASATPPQVALGEQVVRTQGDGAVSSGTYTFALSVQGQSRSVPARFSFAYRKAGGTWLIVSHHSSPMPPPTQPAASAAR